MLASSVPLSMAIVLVVTPATADSVEAMCKASKEVCACVADRLKSAVGDEDYALYEAVGTDYAANKAKGMDMADAWDAAVRVAAGKRGESFVTMLTKTNAIGKTHRDAMKDCAG